jgi:hypothetical protein
LHLMAICIIIIPAFTAPFLTPPPTSAALTLLPDSCSSPAQLAEKGQAEALSKLLELGLPVDGIAGQRDTILLRGAKHGHGGVVALALQKGADAMKVTVRNTHTHRQKGRTNEAAGS